MFKCFIWYWIIYLSIFCRNLASLTSRVSFRSSTESKFSWKIRSWNFYLDVGYVVPGIWMMMEGDQIMQVIMDMVMLKWCNESLNSIWAFKSLDITRYVNCCAVNTRVSWCQSHIAIKCAKFSQIYICSRASEGQLTKLSNIQVAYRRSNGSAASRSSRNQPKYHRLRLKGALSLDFTYSCIIIYHGTL